MLCRLLNLRATRELCARCLKFSNLAQFASLTFACMTLGFVFSVFFTVALPHTATAASMLSPRHSGLEPPGGPKTPEGLINAQPSARTSEGSMGFTDAYGNVVQNKPPAEKGPRQRPRPGAYGGYGREQADERPLPDPHEDEAPPAWRFK